MVKYVLSLVIVLFSTLSFGQSPLLPGELQVNLGFGAADLGSSAYAGLDYGLEHNFTIGAQTAFSGDYFTLGGNANYHFDELIGLPPEWNVYGGLNLGFVSIKENDKDGFSLGAQVGGRYFFNNKWAINLELGGGNLVAGGKVGVTFITF